MKEDTARPKQALVEHLKYIESTRLENRMRAMGGDAMSKEIPAAGPAEAPLDEP
jgi:hypothetical protein